ncbi:AhpC/TSA family protein [Nostoc ellipsosporum NOK]|nr:AhpC/TSA family protein [Nostoc ellipsosporum NOK]
MILFLPLAAFGQKKLTVTGKMTNLPDNTPVWLADINNPTDTIAKAKALKGAFVLKGELTEPKLLILSVGMDKKSNVFFDNSTIAVKGDYAKPASWTITGSAVQNAFKDFETTFVPYFEQLNKIGMRMQAGERSDSLQINANQLTATIQQAIDAFIQKHPGSPVSAFVLLATINLNPDMNQLEERTNRLQPMAMNNMYGSYLKQTIGEGKVTAIGSIARDFTQNDTLDNPVSLSSFRGKYVLIDFWASWCRPCRLENPNVVQAYQRFRDKNFTVLGVSLDRQKKSWIDAIHADNLTWTHVSDLKQWDNAVAKMYKVQSIPQNLLIGPDGKIVAKDLRGEDLNRKLCELLGCN